MDNKIECIRTALVVGGGFGGMAAAISLARRGVHVELIDIDAEWRVYGAGITITGVTLRAYKHLGMVTDIAEKGAITNGARVFRYDGTHLHDFDEPALEDDLPATGGIMRPILHEIMQERVRSLNIVVRLGLTVSGLTDTGGGVDVVFSSGERGHFDLVVGADSIFSGVRELAFPHMGPAEPTGQGCWRISMRRPPAIDRGEFFVGHDYFAGITPCASDAIYLYMLTPHVRRERHFDEEELFVRLHANLMDFGGHAGWVRDNMTRGDWINYRPLSAKIQARPWSMGRTVLLGDAVHATTPHLASGAGMAVESAIVLAEELAATDSVDQALVNYEERRFDRCRFVVETSIEVGNL